MTTRISTRRQCHHGAGCIKYGCPFQHPYERLTDCKFGGSCRNRNCRFLHPRPCKFGMRCYRPYCKATHPEGWEDRWYDPTPDEYPVYYSDSEEESEQNWDENPIYSDGEEDSKQNWNKNPTTPYREEESKQKVDDWKKGLVGTQMIKCDQKSHEDARFVLMIGETGSGKSTTIDSMMNYYYGVEFDDTFRYKVVKQADNVDQTASVTSEITTYHLPQVPHQKVKCPVTIIDTMGYGDTRGHDYDEKTTKAIKRLVDRYLDKIDAICFTITAEKTRLTYFQDYIHNHILSLFAKDVSQNIFLLITFCDGKTPPVLKAIKKRNIPYVKDIRLNNSGFFTRFDEDDDDDSDEDEEENPMTKMFWKMGMKAFESFFKALEETKPVSLKNTKMVLNDRQRLEDRILMINQKINLAVRRLECVENSFEEIEKHQHKIDENAGFLVRIEVPSFEKIDISGKGVHTTTCLECNYTCHDNCVYSNNNDKKHCCSMEKGACTVCPGKCSWDRHVNVPYIIKQTTEFKEEPCLTMKQRHEAAVKGRSHVEHALIQMRNKYEQVQKDLHADYLTARDLLKRIEKYALKANCLVEDQIFENMIQVEQKDRKKGYKRRISAIKDTQKRFATMRDIQRQDAETFVQKGKLEEMDRRIAKIVDKHKGGSQ